MSGRLFLMTETTGRDKRPVSAYGQNFDVRGWGLAKVVSQIGTFPALKAKERPFPSVLRQWGASYTILRQAQGPGADQKQIKPGRR
jgi:hypothetical protein